MARLVLETYPILYCTAEHTLGKYRYQTGQVEGEFVHSLL